MDTLIEILTNHMNYHPTTPHLSTYLILLILTSLPIYPYPSFPILLPTLPSPLIYYWSTIVTQPDSTYSTYL